jgi:hypothetical protein
MNVKQWIGDVRSDFFKRLDLRKHEAYRGGFEPIPDVVIFAPKIEGDWRRRRHEHTIAHMLAVLEVKASERAGKRLSLAEVQRDMRKLHAHREETRARSYDFHPVMIVVDSAREEGERMRPDHIEGARSLAQALEVEWRYLSPVLRQVDRPGSQ